MKPTTRNAVLAILAADDSINPALLRAIQRAVDGIDETRPTRGPLLTISEAARQLGYSRPWLYDRLKEEAARPDEQKTFRTVPTPGGGFRIPQSDIDSFLGSSAPFSAKASRIPVRGGGN